MSDTDWLNRYYSRLIEEYKFSMERKDRLTDWSIAVFFVAIVAYAELLREVTPSIWRISLAVALLCFMVRLFCNSCIAYAYLKKWRFLLDNIEKFWSNNSPTMDKIKEYIECLHYSVKTTETLLYFVRNQLISGYFLLFLFPSLLIFYELLFYEQSIFVALPLVWLSLYIVVEWYRFTSSKYFERYSINKEDISKY